MNSNNILRPILTPNLEIAEERYPKILQLIQDYNHLVDNYGDPHSIGYQNVVSHLQELTGKDMTPYNIIEWWEEEGIEVLVFRIALPDAVKVDDISFDELSEILHRIGHFELYDQDWTDQTFAQRFSQYMDQYYHQLLQLNFDSYDFRSLFGKQKNGTWLTVEEKAMRLWEGNR